tara:strand:- start:232 stop:747 length:516 start_codon:yes stop_codon:yes gene_type:complete
VIAASVNASFQFDGPQLFEQFSDEMLKTLQQAQPAHVVRVESEEMKYHYFAGWHLFHELRRRGMKTIYAVVHTKCPPDIETWAIMAELGISSLAGINERYRTSAYHLLSTHKAIWPNLFSGDRPRTPATALERLCGISRSAAQRIAAPKTPQPKQSVLEEMLTKSSEEDSR